MVLSHKQLKFSPQVKEVLSSWCHRYSSIPVYLAGSNNVMPTYLVPERIRIKVSELWVRGFPKVHHLTLPQRCVGIVWLCAKLTTVTWLTLCIVLALYSGLCRFCDLSTAWNYTSAGASQILKMKSTLRIKLLMMTCLANCSWDAGKPRMVTEQNWK